MPGQFLSPEGDLETIFVSDYEYVDRLVATGSLWMWGAGGSGQLGDGTSANRQSPVQIVTGGTNWKQVACGGSHTGCIKTDGTLWIWGANYDGQLGTNDTTYRSSPLQTVAGGTNWKQVACGGNHTGAIKTDGTLWMWGHNWWSQAGVGGDAMNRLSPVQTLTGGTNWKQVACGGLHTGAIKTDGTLWMWGYDGYGQLGINVPTGPYGIYTIGSPVQTVAGGTNWKQVSCGGYYTGCIKTDGTLWMWGENSYGQLGTGDRTHRSSPVQTITGGTNWKQVSCGGSHAGAIKTDGTLWMWGYDGYFSFYSDGRLGVGVTAHRSSPIQTVAGGTNWKQVSCGGDFTGAIKTDSTLWMWGTNGFYNGQLGLHPSGAFDANYTTHRSSPIQTIAYGTNWKQLSLGGSHTGAIYFNNAGYDFPSAVS